MVEYKLRTVLEYKLLRATCIHYSCSVRREEVGGGVG